jgi:DNA-binding transcriptional LysR family regulator
MGACIVCKGWGAFEEEMGLPLFVRAGRRVEPTAACMALLPRARAAIEAARSVRDAAAMIRSGQAVPARIGCAPHWVRTFLAPVLARLRERAPDVPLPQIVALTTTSATEALLRDDVDLVIQPRIRDLPGEGVRLYELWPAVIGAPRRGRFVDLRELDGQALATGPKDSGLRMTLDDACRVARVTPRIVYESADLASVVVVAALRLCTAIVPSDALDVASRRRAPRLRSGRREFRWENWMHWRSEEALPPAAKHLRDAICDESKRFWTDRGRISARPA